MNLKQLIKRPQLLKIVFLIYELKSKRSFALNLLLQIFKVYVIICDELDK